ncbi:class I SAM-dependent methyltransferase [Halomicroarcula sp. S1AR25-4]|uniref:class I SAM-dependent methyltransferase n=1 Tax=Haloarcula sp. S1AR25-4 TaxID=2950538 RepID=UPI0028770321|nr:class I SAM-dependent methyltransferase [Halomicroarcula sp. S1AR25-4]MDS0276837.1 class I SAM-dependent methyltransferase [Halomicroarcula sp. S1AR25-4]
MGNSDRENRKLWDAWSDDHQALWNAATAEGGLPPVYSPLPDPASMADWQADRLPAREDTAFVELGCGGGQGTVGVARDGVERAVGVDFSIEQLRHAIRLRNLYGVDARFVTGDVTDVPLADGAFDVAYSGFVYFMVEDLDAALTEAHRLLRDGGVLTFDVPHPFHELFDPETLALERSYHVTGPRRDKHDDVLHDDIVVFDRTVGDLHAALVDAGFTVKEVYEVPQSDDPDDYDEDPGGSSSPELRAKVPRTLGFWAVAD